MKSRVVIVYFNLPLIGDKRERVKNNDWSDADYLSRKCWLSEKHKLSDSTLPNNGFIGHGKEPANGRSYLRKGMLSKDKLFLPKKRKRKQKGECGVLIDTLHFMLYTTDIRDKMLKAEDSDFENDEENSSRYQRILSESD